MIKRGNKAGFTLIELMIVVAIIAIIASVAIPKLMAARLSANESAAISTLRSLASAQAQLQSSGAIDTDADGGGEYGFFAELAGTQALRVFDPVALVPALGALPNDRLNPAVLSSAFGNITTDVNGGGVVVRSGYVFKMWLPGPTPVGGGVVPGFSEAPAAVAPAVGGGSQGGANIPDPNNCEILWGCYAWPLNSGQTGNRAFFVNQEGDLLQFANRPVGGLPVYSNFNVAASFPAFDEVYSVAGDMNSPLGINGVASNDGNLWVPVQ